MPLSPALSTLFTLVAAFICSAVATYSAASLEVATALEQWTIPTMNLHFMGNNSGISTGAWPPGMGFNSTMSFTLHRDDGTNSSADTECSGAWVYTKPTFDWTLCDDQLTRWRFVPSGWANEANFTVEIVRVEIFTSPPPILLVQSSAYHVTANNGFGTPPRDPYSFLTCLGSEPFDGIRCTLNGLMSVPGAIHIAHIDNAINAAGLSITLIGLATTAGSKNLDMTIQDPDANTTSECTFSGTAWPLSSTTCDDNANLLWFMETPENSPTAAGTVLHVTKVVDMAKLSGDSVLHGENDTAMFTAQIIASVALTGNSRVTASCDASKQNCNFSASGPVTANPSSILLID